MCGEKVIGSRTDLHLGVFKNRLGSRPVLHIGFLEFGSYFSHK